MREENLELDLDDYTNETQDNNNNKSFKRKKSIKKYDLSKDLQFVFHLNIIKFF
jgi:hypothetical protein